MRRLLLGALLCAGAVGGGLLALPSTAPRGDQAADDTDPRSARPLGDPPGGHSAELQALRRRFDPAALDAFIAAQRARAAELDDAAAWRVLAEAHFERLQLRDAGAGMCRGEPTHRELPAAHRADIEAGLAAADAAIARGDPTGDAWRIRAALLSLSITGLGDYLRLRDAIEAALAEAAARGPRNPRLAWLRASQALFRPSWLGGDAAAAAARLERVAGALPDDERPLILLAYARHLEGDAAGARAALQRAVDRTPANRYAAVVLRRLRLGEPRPFARGIDD